MKKVLGQANHFLITILIGLDGIKQNDWELPSDFSTSWNPKNKTNSVLRSREFALKSSLSWAIDCLDAYFISCNQKPVLIESSELINKINGAHRSIYEKFIIFSQYVKVRSDKYQIYEALTGLAIQWRNNTTHTNANNKLDKLYRTTLITHSKDIEMDFCGLVIKSSLENFDKNLKPTFKEVTSMIRAIQNYVEVIDQSLLLSLDYNRYAREIIEVFFEKHRQEKILFKSLVRDRQLSKITTILKNNGFTDKTSEDSDIHKRIEEEFIEDIRLLSIK